MPTQHSVPQCPVPSVSGPFSAAEHRGGRGWKQGNWDQSVSRCHYQFCPDNTSTFHFHPRNAGERQRGPSQRQWQEQEMMDMKMGLPPPPLHWVDGRICGVISCQSLAPGQEDIQAEVRPATFLLLVSLLKKTNSQESLSGNLCWKQKSGNSTWSVWFISDFFSHFKFDYNSFKFAVIFTVHVKHYCNDFLFSLQCQVGISLCFLSSCLP